MALVQADASAGTGIRMFNPFRDLPAVTSLLGRVFSSELKLDSGLGPQTLGWMKRFPSLAWLWFGLDAWFDSSLTGFVWHENGRIVGNANIAPLSATGRQWVLSNVAVAPNFRGRGIAGALVDACIDFAANHGCERVLLQVWESNVPARHLYERKGFKTVGKTRRLEFSHGYAPVSQLTSHAVAESWCWRHLRRGDTYTLANMAATLSSFEAQAFRSPLVAAFEGTSWNWLGHLGVIFGLGRQHRLVLCEGDSICGGLAIRTSRKPWSRLTIILAPTVQEKLAGPVAEKAALLASSQLGRKVLCDLPDGLALLGKRLCEEGFREMDSLLQMALTLS